MMMIMNDDDDDNNDDDVYDSDDVYDEYEDTYQMKMVLRYHHHTIHLLHRW